MFADIQQLPAAHHLTVDLTNPARSGSPERYWSLTPAQPSKLSFGDASEQLHELFRESIKLHLRSDVPVGAFLSAGIDSSAIVAGMRIMCQPVLEFNACIY